MQGFLEFLRVNYPRMSLPQSITKDNVNMELWAQGTGGYDILDSSHSFLELAIEERRVDLFPLLILLGAEFTKGCAHEIRRIDVAQALVDNGVDLCVWNLRYYTWNQAFDPQFPYFLLDMGLNIPKRYRRNRDDDRGNLIEYHNTILLRVSACRQALLALIRVCKGSKSLRGLRGIVLCLARQVWAQKGGEGVGPRAHKWF
jgi:hypothetical protein